MSKKSSTYPHNLQAESFLLHLGLAHNGPYKTILQISIFKQDFCVNKNACRRSQNHILSLYVLEPEQFTNQQVKITTPQSIVDGAM